MSWCSCSAKHRFNLLHRIRFLVRLLITSASLRRSKLSVSTRGVETACDDIQIQDQHKLTENGFLKVPKRFSLGYAHLLWYRAVRNKASRAMLTKQAPHCRRAWTAFCFTIKDAPCTGAERRVPFLLLNIWVNIKTAAGCCCSRGAKLSMLDTTFKKMLVGVSVFAPSITFNELIIVPENCSLEVLDILQIKFVFARNGSRRLRKAGSGTWVDAKSMLSFWENRTVKARWVTLGADNIPRFLGTLSTRSRSWHFFRRRKLVGRCPEQPDMYGYFYWTKHLFIWKHRKNVRWQLNSLQPWIRKKSNKIKQMRNTQEKCLEN